MSEIRNVLIVGGGVGGLTAAIALARHGVAAGKGVLADNRQLVGRTAGLAASLGLTLADDRASTRAAL